MLELLTVANLVSLLTLTALEIVLNIDNIIFISIIAGRLPKEQQANARRIGILLALIVRIGLLFGVSWIVSLKNDLFHLPIIEQGISGKDLILFFGGLFLIWKSTTEVHHKFDEADDDEEELLRKSKSANFNLIIAQIVGIDIIFSIDSILTAVGLVKHVEIMIVAVLIALAVMLTFVGKISDFVERHPTVKMLALSFLIMIGTLLVGESLDVEVPKGYVYFAMAFSFLVEMLNIRLRTKKKVAGKQN